MSEYSLQQQNIISQYRQSNNLGFVISDDEVVSIMQKEMQKTGKVYPGFENLAVSKKGNKDVKNTDQPTPTVPNNNLFGAVGIKDLSIGVTLERSKTNYATILPTQSQTDAINFLKDITNEADAIVKEQDKESGVLSSVVNTWQELFNKEYAKSTVKKELSKTQQDIALLEKSSKGEPISYDFLGNPKVSTFEESFRNTRGVEFNEKNIQDCQEKAQDYAQVKTAVEMINKTKENLSFSTKGDVTSQMNPDKASRAIIDAFKLAGINSKEEINKTLKDINEKYKEHPDVKKYGGDFRLSKNKQGKYVIYRTDKSGYPAEATNEELKLIAKEMSTRLDKSLATALGVEYKENATSEELSTLTQNTLEKYQKEYEASFSKAFGKKDLKILSEHYVQNQQQGVANIEMGLNIASMALMVVPGGAVATSGWALKGAVALKSTTTGAKVVKGLGLVDKAKKGVKLAQNLQKVQKATSPVIMANMTLRPTELFEQLSSENGMSAEEWQAWGEGVLQNSVYMTAGMGASKIAEQGAAIYKTKALVNTLKKAGKSSDEISAMVKANPVKFPNDIVKSFKKVDTLAKTLQVSSEVALDISSTYLVNKVMGNGDVTKQDWINSVAFAISGGVLQKQFAHLNTESKVKYIHDAFKEYGVTKEEAQNILKAMDDISEGKIRVKYNKNNISKKTNIVQHAVDNEEIAPFAKRVEKTPGIEELTNSQIKELKLENGEFDENGNFISDGTYVKVESGNPLNKGTTYKSYSDGDLKLAENFDDLIDQIVKIRSGKKLYKGEISQIKDMLDKNPDLSISDFSTMINDLVHATDISMKTEISHLFDGYMPFKNITNFKIFKSNIDLFDKFITDLASNSQNIKIVSKLKNLRAEYFTEKMPQIATDDFKRNLEFYKSLDKDLRRDLIKYDYDILFAPHDKKYFDRIKIADDFNRFVDEQNDYQIDVKCDEYSRHYPKLNDEEFVQLKKNMDLAKELIKNKVHCSNFINHLVNSNEPQYSEFVDILKSQLKDNFDYKYIPYLRKYINDKAMLDVTTTLINTFPKDDDVIISSLYRINDSYRTMPENEKNELINRIKIAGKLPQLVKYGDMVNETLLVSFLKEADVKNSDKIQEFVTLAEPEFLKKIGLNSYASTAIFDFNRLFTENDLDNMIECAKLHKELPKEFCDYLKSKDSIIGSSYWNESDNLNYQYKVAPEELKSRIEIINEYRQKLPPAILERIYNGTAKISKNTLEALTQIDDVLAVNFVSNRNVEVLEQIDKDVLDRFVNYIKNEKIGKESAQKFSWNLYSSEQMDFFKNLSEDELSAISFKSLSQNFSANLQNRVDIIKEIIAKTPKRLRDFIKDDINISFYVDYAKLYKDSEYGLLVDNLKKLSDEDLKSIGPKTIIKYLNQNYRVKELNPRNIELWRDIPKDVKTKLDEHAFNLLASEKIVDIDKINAEIDNLKKYGVYENISDYCLYDVLINTSPEMKKCIDDIISNPDFDSKNINSLIYNLQHLKTDYIENVKPEDYSEEWDFVQELINEPKLNVNDINNVICTLNRDKKSCEIQKNFARYLINRGDLDGNTIRGLLYKISHAKWLEGRGNDARIDFAKQLLDNPNIKKEDVPDLVEICKGPISDNVKKTVVDMMSTKKYKVADVQSLFESIADELNNYSDAKVDTLRTLVLDNNIDVYEVNSILANLVHIKDENSIRLINSFLDNLIKNNKVENSQIKEMVEIFLSNQTISPEILIQKINNFIDAELDFNTIKDICENAKVLSIFNDDLINVLKKLKDSGANISQIVDLISNNVIAVKLSDKVNTLISLGKLSPEDKAIFSHQGIDIDSKINSLMLEINKKYPTIDTPKENIKDFLNHIKNTDASDRVIQTADFEKFGKSGIPLEYSRDEFIQNMDNIIRKYFPKVDLMNDNVKIPELKLSQLDKELTAQKIKDLRSKHKSEEVEVIIDGNKALGTRFLETQGGSNTAYYTQIGDKLYYIKYPDKNKLGQSIEEVIASKLYRAAGIDSPNMKFIYDENKNIIGMAGEYVPNLSKEPKSVAQKYDGFAVDAWLANWDAPKNDNTQYRDNGVVKVDVGGSLRYRARGELKDFGNVVNELSSLIEQNYKFMSMSKQDLQNSLKHVTDVSSDLIQSIVLNSPINDTSLINVLLKRKEYITIFAQKIEELDEKDFPDILHLINYAKQLTNAEFKTNKNVAELLGYERTKTGFEGLLNTKGTENIALSIEEKRLAEELKAEIKKYTIQNKISESVDLTQETKDFLNSIVSGVPEFAAFFGKPQHSSQKYSLDVHILKVLQDSMNDPLYKKLNDSDKTVLKLSTLLHDIGKRYLGNTSDTGHAAKSAEYVYSILEKFNFSDEIKDRIISVVQNHHWFKAYNLGQLSNREIATLCRRPEDFLIFRIMAKADANNVNDHFFEDVMHAKTVEQANLEFDKKMNEIEKYVQELAEKQVVITTSKFKKIPQRISQDGRVLPERSFPKEEYMLDGKKEEFEVLNLTKLDSKTNLFKYGFDNVTLENLRLAVHMVNSKINLEIFKSLANNPINNSAQSISMISMADKSTYSNLIFGLVLDLDNANVSHAYYANTGSGTKKGFSDFVQEMFEDSKHRNFVKDKFFEYMFNNNIELSNAEYAQIAKEIMSKKYPETQIKDFHIGSKIFKKEDIISAFKYSRDQLIEQKKMKTHGFHNEIVALNSKVKGLTAKVNSLDDCPKWFLEFAHDNNLPIILLGNDY